MKIKAVLMALLASSAMMASAELNSELGKDGAGNTTLTVKNDNQKGLPPAQLGISPAKVEGVISSRSPRLDKSVTFYNYSAKPKQLKLTLMDKNEQSSIKDWTLINPKTITIAPHSQQTIRLSFRPPKNTAVQTHDAILFIEQQIKDPISVDESGQGVSMQIGSRYGLPISMTYVVK